MGWQEEEVAEIRRNNEQYDSRVKVREKIAFDFWDKFLGVNNGLLPELKMTQSKSTAYVETHALTHGRGSIVLQITEHQPDGNFYTFGVTGTYPNLNIFLDKLDHLVGSVTTPPDEPYMDPTVVYFKIDAYTPELIIKNIMQRKSPHTGLQIFDYDPKTGIEKTVLDKIFGLFGR